MAVTVDVVGSERKVTLDLPEPKASVLHEVVAWQLSKRRAGTAATKTVALRAATSATLWFGDALAFPGVSIAQAQCTLTSAAPAAFSVLPQQPHEPLALSVAFAEAVTGAITCTVDQSQRSHAAL